MKVLMIGASKSGEMLSSILTEYENCSISFLDDNKDLWGKSVCGLPVLNSPVKYFFSTNKYKEYDRAFISIGLHKLMDVREELFNLVRMKMSLINIIHPTAHVSKDAVLGEGNYIGAYSYIGPHCEVGDCNYFSANTILEHHTKVGNLNSWGPFNATSGSCVFGDRVKMGTKISMIYNVSVGSNSSIASDVLLFKNVGKNKIVRNKEFPNYTVSDDRRSRKRNN